MAMAPLDAPLDSEHAPLLLERLRPLCAGRRRILVDLRRSDFVDSAGVRALLQLQRALDESGGELRLVVQANSRAQRVLQLLQLEERFAIFTRLVDAWTRPSPRK